MPKKQKVTADCPWATAPKTTDDLARLLWQDMSDLVVGKITLKQARARNAYAGKLIRTLEADLRRV